MDRVGRSPTEDRHRRLRGRRLLRLAVLAIIATVPAWLFWLASISTVFTFSTIRVFALVAIALSTVIALLPSIQDLAGWFGRPVPEWSPSESSIVASFAAGGLVSILLNAGSTSEGLETFIAGAIALSMGAGLYNISRVASSPSPAAEKSRRAAEEAIRKAQRSADDQNGYSTPSVPVGSGTITEIAGDVIHIYAQAEVGRQDVAAGFRQYGDQNETYARLFLSAGVLLFAGSVVAALMLVSRLGDSAGTAAILARAAITLPGAAVFGVFVRESAARRRYAAWGGLIAIQAENIGAFVSDMPEQSREEIELEFAKSVFRGGDVALDQTASERNRSFLSGRPSRADQGNDKSAPAAEAVSALAKDVMDMAKTYAETVRELHSPTTSTEN